MNHVKKCWPESFQAIRAGRKKFEWRAEDDCTYDEGDTLELHEWDPHANDNEGGETGDVETVAVTYVLRGRFGVPPGYAVLSIDRVAEGEVSR